MPIYYVSFHFSAIGQFEVFRDRIVWVVWLPIWLLALAECADWLRRRLASRSLHTWVRPDGKGG
jgi:hypothetical protein